MLYDAGANQFTKMRFEKIHDVIPLPTAIPQNQRKPMGHKTRERYASLCGKSNIEKSVLEKKIVCMKCIKQELKLHLQKSIRNKTVNKSGYKFSWEQSIH